MKLTSGLACLMVGGLTSFPAASSQAPLDLTQKPDYALLDGKLRKDILHRLKNDQDIVETREALKRLGQAGLPPLLLHKSHIGEYGLHLVGDKDIHYLYLGKDVSLQAVLRQFTSVPPGTKLPPDWERWLAFFSACSDEDFAGLAKGASPFARLVAGMELAAHPNPRGVKIVRFHRAFPPLSPSLRVGDILLRLERDPVKEPDEVRALLKAYRVGAMLKLMAFRPSAQLTLTLSVAIPDEPGSRFASLASALGDDQMLKANHSTERLQQELKALDDVSPEALRQRHPPQFEYDARTTDRPEAMRYLISVGHLGGTQAYLSRGKTLQWLEEMAAHAARWAGDGEHPDEQITLERLRISWQYVLSLTDEEYAAELRKKKDTARQAPPRPAGTSYSVETKTSEPTVWLGAEMKEPPASSANPPRPGRGLVVKAVTPSSPAEKGGLHPGDILLTLEKHPLTTSKDLDELLKTFSPGSRVKLSLVRNGKPLECLVTLEARTAR